jgi:hypothetical protein
MTSWPCMTFTYLLTSYPMHPMLLPSCPKTPLFLILLLNSWLWPCMTFTYLRSCTVICSNPPAPMVNGAQIGNLRWSDIHTVREKSATWHLLITNLDTSRTAGSSTLSSFFLIPYYLSFTFYYLSPTPYSHLSHFSHLTLSFTLNCPFLTLYSLYLTR